MDYKDFLKKTKEFIFVENKPEKADIIFVPGNGYPQMAEKRPNFTEKVTRLSFCQAGNTVLPQAVSAGSFPERRNIMDLMRQNGNFSVTFW